MARKYSSNITRRLWAGPLFGDILDRMQKVMELPAGARHAVEASKFFGYVGHDITGLEI
jgi:hypothetical protein